MDLVIHGGGGSLSWCHDTLMTYVMTDSKGSTYCVALELCLNVSALLRRIQQTNLLRDCSLFKGICNVMLLNITLALLGNISDINYSR
jgi:hypothetical protein